MDLKTLTELRAPSGHEQPIRRALLAELKDMGLDPQLDRMGNVVVVKQGTKGADAPRVMVAAHMDEVGLLVANATEEGFLRTLPVGGVDSRVVISKRVLCGDEAIPGVIGAMAIHLQTAEDRKHVLFLLSASIGDFAAVGGVSQNILDVGCCEHIAPRVLME